MCILGWILWFSGHWSPLSLLFKVPPCGDGPHRERGGDQLEGRERQLRARQGADRGDLHVQPTLETHAILTALESGETVYLT